LEQIEQGNAEVIQNVPIVSMRLSSRKGIPISEVREDTTLDISGWALSREYRVTYRDSLIDSETIIEGEWIGESDGIGSVVPISIADNIDDDLNVEVGDTLGFNVQGVPVTTVVSSIREVDFDRPQPNFFVLFPKGVLEEAPQFFASTVRTNSREQTIALQQQVTTEFPNISSIDISVALQSVREFLDKMALAIQFMAFFSILTGFIVLASSIAISRKQRTRESVLLRTLGANKSQIGSIQTIEYALLGLLSGLTGLLLAVVSSWALAYFYFELVFVPDLVTVTVLSLLITIAAILIGWSGSRHIFNHSPLEILRLETG
jgi:putative ABC transport system permease protein